jgi:hypothetical protein
VNSNSPGANSIASDSGRAQESGTGQYTNPTQLQNGTYTITENPRAPSTGNGRFGTGEQGLYINATQTLPGINPDTLEQLDGISYQDTGYMLHITDLQYTNGCIGISYDPSNPKSRSNAVKEVEYIVNQYKDAKNKGERITITIME